jgi:hypothetical protein
MCTMTDDGSPSREAWLSLEFLAWVVHNHGRKGHRVQLRASSAPPYMNEPGETIYFVLEADYVDPDDFAGEVAGFGDEYFGARREVAS